jgi:hypothetical protein
MKNIIFMTIGVVVLRQVARYFKIKSFEDVVDLMKPFVKDVMREAKPLTRLSFHLN